MSNKDSRHHKSFASVCMIFALLTLCGCGSTSVMSVGDTTDEAEGAPVSGGDTTEEVAGAPVGGPRVIFNTDTSSAHLARIVSREGTVSDVWVERDESGSLAFISSLRAKTTDGNDFLFEFDDLGRPTFVQDSSGSSVRVHSYLTESEVDVTITLPDGSAARGTMDLASLPSDTEGAKTLVPKRKTDPFDIRNAQTLDEDLCRALRALFELVKGGRTLESLIKLVGCLTSIAIDVVTIPDIITSVTGCAASFAGGHIVSEVINRSIDALLSIHCPDAEEAPLGEGRPQPPGASECANIAGEWTGTLRFLTGPGTDTVVPFVLRLSQVCSPPFGCASVVTGPVIEPRSCPLECAGHRTFVGGCDDPNDVGFSIVADTLSCDTCEAICTFNIMGSLRVDGNRMRGHALVDYCPFDDGFEALLDLTRSGSTASLKPLQESEEITISSLLP